MSIPEQAITCKRCQKEMVDTTKNGCCMVCDEVDPFITEWNAKVCWMNSLVAQGKLHVCGKPVVDERGEIFYC